MARMYGIDTPLAHEMVRSRALNLAKTPWVAYEDA